MRWNKYQADYIAAAQNQNLPEPIVSENLTYAHNLFLKRLPIIFDVSHLSQLVGYHISYLNRAVKYTQYFYRHYHIPKKNGGTRLISEPLPSLKEIQNWILKEILEKCEVSKYAKAYVKKRSLRSNASFHRDKNLIILIDITNFFGSISKDKIKYIFLSLGYKPELSEMLSGLCTLNNSLPQGAPTSPYLSNLVAKSMDDKISRYCLNNKISYTRYSDDLAFSGTIKTGALIKFIKEVFNENGFVLNENKLRTKNRNQSQRITGIVVNKHLQAPKKTRKLFRQNVYYIKKYGLENHLNRIKNNKDNYIEHLIGKGLFICFVNKNDRSAKKDLEYLSKLKNDIFKAGEEGD